MVSYNKRIDRTYNSALSFAFDDRSKIVVMSDCHRGCGSLADDFAKNQNVCYAALQAYKDAGYIYIEAGDGDELWKNKKFADIALMHADVFSLLAGYYKSRRIVMALRQSRY